MPRNGFSAMVQMSVNGSSIEGPLGPHTLTVKQTPATGISLPAAAIFRLTGKATTKMAVVGCTQQTANRSPHHACTLARPWRPNKPGQTVTAFASRSSGATGSTTWKRRAPDANDYLTPSAEHIQHVTQTAPVENAQIVIFVDVRSYRPPAGVAEEALGGAPREEERARHGN